jgi:Asp-tRNA(Asn)/Glu-tRNA(Gln) amidotransferase A subunit family amidase
MRRPSFHDKKNDGRSWLNLDDPEVSNGSPVGVQLLGRRFEEEKILTLAEYIHAQLKDW